MLRGVPPRGRPRRFDPEQALATAQRLFHARGIIEIAADHDAGLDGSYPKSPQNLVAFADKEYARIVHLGDRYDADIVDVREGGAGYYKITDSLERSLAVVIP